MFLKKQSSKISYNGVRLNIYIGIQINKYFLKGTLKIYTGKINADTDYKTLKISTSHTAKNVIDTILGKFRTSCRDPNLFEIFMEVRTKINGDEVSCRFKPVFVFFDYFICKTFCNFLKLVHQITVKVF